MTDTRPDTKATARRLRRQVPGLGMVWWGAGFALVGTEVFEVTALLLTTAVYGAVLSVGALGLALRLAPMVLAPVLIAALDRRPQLRAQFARSSVLARAIGVAAFALAVLTNAAPLAMYVLVGVIAALDAAYLSAVRATLPRLVPTEDQPATLGRANAMLVVQWNTAQVLVPPVVVWLLDLTGAPMMLGIGITALLVAFVVLDRYVRAYLESCSTDPAPAARPAPFWSRLSAGWRAIWGDPVARAVVVLAAAGQGAIFTYSLALPQVAVAPGTTLPVGLALSAMAVGSIIGARRAGTLDRPALQFDALRTASVVAAFALLVMGAAPSVPVVLVVSFVLGAAAGLATVPRSTLLQSRFSHEVLGGVLVAAMVLGQVLMPVLPGVWEFVADRAGVFWAFGVLAALQGAALAVVWLSLRAAGGPRAALGERR